MWAATVTVVTLLFRVRVNRSEQMPRDDPDPLQLLRQITGGCLDRDLRPEELFQIRNAINQYLVPVADHENKILLLGSYSEAEKERLAYVKATLETLYRNDGQRSVFPFLLEDVAGTDVWINTEIKFRLFASVADHIVGVPESNYGGFVFEQGVLSSNPEFHGKTSLLKKQYPNRRLC